jgi:Cft2 family RNA processing exonuclease
MFYWDDGLRLAKADLAIDFRRRQPRAFISHAHIDHMARHEYALCTPATAALYQARFGPRAALEIPCRQPIVWGGLRLTTYPAGHCLGSAMLLAEDEGHSLLYTGDFKLGESATAERAELTHAEILVIESTYGVPDYRLPPRNEVLSQLFDLVRQVFAQGGTPVIEAYTLGKSQEVTRLLTAEGFAVEQHSNIYAISRVYEALGVPLGDYTRLQGLADPNRVLVVPPGTPRRNDLAGEVRIALTGWALDPSTKFRLRVDHALALSDHADYDELHEAVARVNPRKVYCTHGPESFVDRLREAGYDAHPLGRDCQRWLF